ncbi:MAG TPA: GNAT family N-acetyltransferase [Vicinamibacterales bacterium]
MFLVRSATLADRATIAHHRVAIFIEIDRMGPSRAEVLADATQAYLADAMPLGEYVGWLAAPVATPSRVVAGCGVQVRNVAPFPWRFPKGGEVIAAGRQALIVNVYTEPEVRRLGLARRLLTTVVDWARTNRVDSLILHATPSGRPLYESLGFESTNEMRFMGDLR